MGIPLGTSCWRQLGGPSRKHQCGWLTRQVLCCISQALRALRASPVGMKEPNPALGGLFDCVLLLQSVGSIGINRGAFKTERDMSHCRGHQPFVNVSQQCHPWEPVFPAAASANAERPAPGDLRWECTWHRHGGTGPHFLSL